MWNLPQPTTNGLSPLPFPGVFIVRHLEHFSTEQTEQPGQSSTPEGHTKVSVVSTVVPTERRDTSSDGSVVRQPGCTTRRSCFCFLGGGAGTSSSSAGAVRGRPGPRVTVGGALGSTYFVGSFGLTTQPLGCFFGSASHRPFS